MQSHQEGLQLLGMATRMFEIIKSQTVQILWGITHAAGDQGPIKENEEAIRNMPRKTTLYHKIGKKKFTAREHEGESEKHFQQKAPQP